jgi:hypothetical protein
LKGDGDRLLIPLPRDVFAGVEEEEERVLAGRDGEERDV